MRRVATAALRLSIAARILSEKFHSNLRIGSWCDHTAFVTQGMRSINGGQQA
jgi:hypothetical protein